MDVVAKGWIASVGRGLADLPDADTVLRCVRCRIVDVVRLARRIDAGPRSDRLAAVERLIDLTGIDSTELADHAAAAVRLGVQDAADAAGWTSTHTKDVARRAVDALLEFERSLDALGNTMRASERLERAER